MATRGIVSPNCNYTIMIFIYSKSFKILLFTFITSRPKHVQQNNIVRRTAGCKCWENNYWKLTTILYTWSSHSYRMTTIVSHVSHRSCLSISVWSPYYNAPERNTGSYVPDSLREVHWFFNVPVNHFREEKGDGTYGLSFLPEKNRCQSKNRNILLNILRPWVLARSWAWTLDLLHASRAL